MATKTIVIPAETYLNITNQLDELDRTIGALRGFSAGLHYAVDERQVNGEDLEILINLIEERIQAQVTQINQGVLALGRNTDLSKLNRSA